MTFSWSEQEAIFGSKFPLEKRAIIKAICVALFFELRPFRINPSEIYGGYILVAVHLFSLLSQTRSEHSNRVFFGAKKKIQIQNNVVRETEKWLPELSDDLFSLPEFRPIGKQDLGLDTSVDTPCVFLPYPLWFS